MNLKKICENLVELKDIKGDLHLHTTRSDGAMFVDDIVAWAKQHDYKYIGIADHSESLKIAGGVPEKDMLQAIHTVRTHGDNGVKVFISSEIEVKSDGATDYSDAVIKGLDYVVLALHTRGGDYLERVKVATGRMLSLGKPCILAHPTARELTIRDMIEAEWNKVFELASKSGVILEINAQWLRLDLPCELVRIAKEAGCRFVINTDTHGVEEIAFMRFGIDVARRAGLSKADIINTQTQPF